ncbi:MAG: hypothetical protein ACI8RE_000932 [Ilumatobacter sp.]|jgi:hypothetical protein
MKALLTAPPIAPHQHQERSEIQNHQQNLVTTRTQPPVTAQPDKSLEHTSSDKMHALTLLVPRPQCAR